VVLVVFDLYLMLILFMRMGNMLSKVDTIRIL
jgi:hypothetical protein